MAHLAKMTNIRRFVPRTVVILAYDSVQVLDVTGPASVFGAARDEAPGAYELIVASARGGAVTTNCGVTIGTTSVRRIDPARVGTLLIAGGDERGLRELIRDGKTRDWALKAARYARRVGSVCTGAFVLAAWELLDGRRVATHWQSVDELARRFPALDVDGQALYVEDGRFWTSAGITTGIDMSLALVERDLGAAVATSVARRLVLYARRPGHQSQFSALLAAQGGGDYSGLIGWIADNLDRPLDIEELAGRAGQSPRTFHRRFTAATKKTPAAFVEALRLDRARTLLGEGAPLKRAAAVAGFGSADRLTRAFTRAFGVSPSTWRAIHAREAA